MIRYCENGISEKTKAKSLRKNGKKEGMGWWVAKIKYSATVRRLLSTDGKAEGKGGGLDHSLLESRMKPEWENGR
jgi:hypothetical protein